MEILPLKPPASVDFAARVRHTRERLTTFRPTALPKPAQAIFTY
jgi:hypothetical protein